MKKAHILLVLGLLAAFALTSRDVLGYYGTTYPWTMYRYNMARTGETNSPAPNNNASLWSISGYYGIGSPLVVNGMVIFTDYYNLYAFDETTGVKLWGPAYIAYLYGSPTLVGDRIYIGATNGYVYCYNATNGASIWGVQVTSGQFQTAPVVANGKVYIGSTDNNLYALNATNGLYLWQYTTGGAIYYSSPAIDGDLLFFGSDDGKVYALNVSKTTPSLKWFYPTNGQIRSTPCVANGMLFIGSSYNDHALFVLNETTGAFLWKYQLSYGSIDTAPAFSAGLVFFTSSSLQKVYALYANATVGINYTDPNPAVRLWSTTVGSSTSSPVIADGKVFVSGGSYLYALDISTGLILWSYSLGTTGYDPVVADGRIFASTYQYLYCIGNPFPPVTYYFTVTPFPGYNYVIQLDTNSTPSQIDITGLITLKKLNYTVTGIPGTMGMSNITIPKDLLDGTITITVDGADPYYAAPPIDNGTHTILYFTYFHSSHQIVITGTTVVPEFPITALAPLLVLVSLIAVTLAKKKLPRN